VAISQPEKWTRSSVTNEKKRRTARSKAVRRLRFSAWRWFTEGCHDTWRDFFLDWVEEGERADKTNEGEGEEGERVGGLMVTECE
jgi:hypothetical protein